jgi:hypothetical protein
MMSIFALLPYFFSADDRAIGMGSRQTTQMRARPWVEWFARRIEDPVSRLKFLQAVTPLAVPRKRRWRRVLTLTVVLILALLAFFVYSRASTRAKTVLAATPRPPARNLLPVTALSKVWLVDKSSDSETFSNGLRIDTRFESANHPRSYMAYPVERPDEGAGVVRDQPAGIVFHTTESRQVPFEAGANGALKQIAESLLDFVRRKHAYHFLIDRFGRVYRIVSEADAANHAGYSVWADDAWLYLNLNESFLGISFEAETEPGQLESSVSPAQIRSAAMLTEMLRDRYAIPAANCVTHAQVSVNPDNMRAGYHTDWASSFPFKELGLPDNYARPLPALTEFGFQYDANFQRLAGIRLYAGVELAEQELGRRSAESGMRPQTLLKMLQMRYRRRLAESGHLNTSHDESEAAEVRSEQK